ncbi:MAG: hypothetical protein ABL949_14380 [Fimbriimonadaceae bacterium]
MVFALVAFAHLQSGRITFDTLAARVPVILKKLSPVIGQELSSDASFTNEVMIVHVKGVDSEQLLERIAFANVATWRKEDNRLVMVPDLKRRAEQERDLDNLRLKRIQRILGVFEKELSVPITPEFADQAIKEMVRPPKFAGSSDYLVQAKWSRVTPLSRLGMRAMLALGAQRLASVKTSDRLVFSNRPGPLQLPLPNSNRLIGEFQTETQIFERALGGFTEDEQSQAKGGYGWNKRGASPQPYAPGRALQVLVSVTDLLTNHFREPSVAVRAEDGSTSGTPLNYTIQPETITVAEPQSTDKTPFELRPLSVATGKVIRSAYKPESLFDPVVADFLRKPVENEPLSLGSEVYGQYADRRGLNLVAVINDNAFERLLGLEPRLINPVSFEIVSRPSLVFAEKAGWLTLTPSSPVEARRNRDSRATIERVLASRPKNSGVFLRAAGAYVLERPYTAIYGMGWKLDRYSSSPSKIEGITGDEDINRLIGSLSDSQFNNLKSGHSIEFRNLSKVQQALVHRLIYGPQFYTSDSGMAVPLDGNFDEVHPKVWEDPTITLPEGIPADSLLCMNFTSLIDLLPQPSRGHSNGDGFRTAASGIFYRKHPELVDLGSGDVSFADRYVPLDQTQVRFVLKLPREMIWRGRLTANRALSEAVSLDKLPKAHREAINREYESMEKQLKSGVDLKFKMSRSDQTQKPPPSN